MGNEKKRNYLCGCGSGKKFKKCCARNRKSRTATINIDRSNITIMDGIAISPIGQISGYKDGKLIPLTGDASIEYGYNSEKRFKSLSKGPISTKNLYINPSLSLLEFDHIYVVDTNTKPVGEDKVSVAAILHCKVESRNQESANFAYAFVGWFEYRNVIGNEEKLVWMQISKAISHDPKFLKAKIGLLVDCDSSNYPQFNERKLPIYANYYLPSNISLIYSSADGGKETLINRLIAFCDTKANELLKHLATGQFEDSKVKSEVCDQPYSHFRKWIPSECESNHLNLSGLEWFVSPL